MSVNLKRTENFTKRRLKADNKYMRQTPNYLDSGCATPGLRLEIFYLFGLKHDDYVLGITSAACVTYLSQTKTKREEATRI